MKLRACPRTLIINALRKNPDGLTLTSIAKFTGLHRHTATKYIYELKGAGVINERDIGSAKLCYLREGLSREDEKKVVGRLNGSRNWRKSSASIGQAQILTVFLFLLMIPATAIIAQNVTQTMETHGNLVLGQAGAIEATQENMSDASLTQIETLTEEVTQAESLNETLPDEGANIAEGITANFSTDGSEILNDTKSEFNLTLNETEQTEPENVTGNETTFLPYTGIFENESVENGTQNNLTRQEGQSNETIQEPQAEPPAAEILRPVLDVRIVSKDRIIRGEALEISATVENTGGSEAKNVRLEWILPSGFGIVSGDSEECGTIPPGSECVRSITASPSLSTETGKSQIKVLVRYEE